ncbi:tyrosine-type recombinase/integrase [Nitrosopumilus sp. K4]|uniref:tyrosine-type recombinase/integrase n=1 Tax=Nitrosopumilus sp. K4 TaxID=2795383 RepID=UPI001BA66A56|nr:tyrosine-type recombinase/integrase [Nitrosopumilus sp. K4]QUC64376.1 tyrosine-type recombinase/integrase [Nitrosopumilus sp. K4]
MTLTRKQILHILCNADLKLKIAILLASSAGLRISELIQLRYSDIDFDSKPTKILIRATSKKKRARQVFITEETTIHLQDYLKKNFGWHKNSLNLDISSIYIFGRTSVTNGGNVHRFNPDSAKQSLQMLLKNHVKNISEQIDQNKNEQNTIRFYEFRKFFSSTVENVCGRNYAEALMGNRDYMDTHYQLSDEDKYQKYFSVEPYLTILDFDKIEENYNDLSQRYKEIEKSIIGLKQYLVSNSILLESLK